MRLHKWFVRGLVFTALTAMAGGAVVYQRWTDPAAVRQQVIAALECQFPGADVTLEAARLRLFGGILLSELRLLRHDDLSRNDLTYIPSAVIYHDKEQLLDGVLALRKVELHRPRFRIVRDGDGRWNFDGLSRPGTSDAPLPAVIINEGTIHFEDHLTAPGLPPVEFTGIQATLLNDPPELVKFEGTGVSGLVGQVRLQGTWRRDSGELQLALEAANTPLNAALVQRLAANLPGVRAQGVEVKGQANVQLRLDYRPGTSTPLDYDVRLQVRQGFCRHPALPLPLDRVELDAHCQNGLLTIEHAEARSGETRWAARGSTRLPDWQDSLVANLSAENLPVNQKICSCLPDEVRQLHQLFRPNGPVNLQVHLDRKNGCWREKRCSLQPQQIDVCYADFPYAVGGVTGTVEADLLTGIVKVDLAARTLPVGLTGVWQGGADGLVDLYLRANQVPLDDKLVQALPAGVRDLARSFHARGATDVQAHIYHARGAGEFRNTYQARIYDGSMRWDEFQYPLEKLSGVLTIHPDHVEFQDFRASHNGGTVLVSGKTIPWSHGGGPNLTRLCLDIAGHDIGIDADLRKALGGLPSLGKAWDTMVPSGRLSFHARIDQIPNRPQDLEIAVKVRGCRLQPVFFRYPLSDLSGDFSFRHNRLEVQNVVARHGSSQLAIGRGAVDLSPNGGYYANLEDVRGSPIYPDDGLIQALPPSMQRVFTSLSLRDPLVLQTQLVIAQSDEPGSHPDVFWKGQGQFTNIALQAGVGLEHVTGKVGCTGRYDGQRLHGLNANVLLSEATVFQQPLKNLQCNLVIHKETPDVLALDLRVPAFGGDISGQAHLDLNSTLRYDMKLIASQIDLHEFGKQNLKDRTNLQGKASAVVHLFGQGTDVNTLGGNGTVHIPQGAKLYNLPFLLDLLKFLGLRWPDSTAFEEAYASFSIHGTRLAVQRVDLWGNAISLTGQGEVNLNGTDVKLDFYPSWARLEQLLPSGLRSLTPTVSKNLLKIEVRGNITSNPADLQFHKRPVPGLVEPFIDIRDRIAGMQKTAFKINAGGDRY